MEIIDIVKMLEKDCKAFIDSMKNVDVSIRQANNQISSLDTLIGAKRKEVSDLDSAKEIILKDYDKMKEGIKQMEDGLRVKEEAIKEQNANSETVRLKLLAEENRLKEMEKNFNIKDKSITQSQNELNGLILENREKARKLTEAASSLR